VSRGVRGVLAALAAGAGVAALLAGAVAWNALRSPYAGWSGDEVVVVLDSGLDAGSMLGELAEAGVLRHPRLARAWLAWRGEAGRLQAGEYRFEDPASALAVLERLLDGDVVLHLVTVPEGLTLEETAARLAAAGVAGADALRAAFQDPEPIRDLDAEAPDLEGYLFPETYNFSRGHAAGRIARAMVDQFRRAAGPELAARAAAVGLSTRGAVTLASLIEKETSIPGERPRVSRVFHNRLQRGMRLECDPTVLYALARAGRPAERLTREHLRFESPWNTYVTSGLPRGPIASPGRDSLRAALEPAEGDDLFFVAAPGGGHIFSRTLDGHRQAVAEWRLYTGSSR